jgi:aerobic carbon-monoxide dehydrogenase medium subunit
MRPSQFDLSQPKSIQEAATLARGGAVLLGGGQALIQALRLRTAKPSRIVDLKHVAELSRDIQPIKDGLRIGALVTVTTLLESELVSKQLPMLHDAASRLGDVQVRNRATVVGNVCWADPRANFAVALLAYDAVLRIYAGRSERVLPVAQCFSGFRAIALKAGEIVCAIEVPVAAPPLAGGYLEFSRQRNDLALVSMAVLRRHDGSYSVAAGGLAQTPLRLKGVESMLATGAAGATIESLKAGIEKSPVESLGDPFGPLTYKVHVGAVLLSHILAKLNTGASHVER